MVCYREKEIGKRDYRPAAATNLAGIASIGTSPSFGQPEY